MTTGGNNADTTWSGQITTSGGVTKVGTGNFTITSGQQFTGSYIQNGGVTTLANTNGPGLF
ncbi:MAG: hypothetical protein EBT95_09245, partial [Verrucomicrobia bacterium]|nr:hypothetical protein [Verrucomicrobiota bacterium]